MRFALRSSLLIVATAASLSFAACGGGGDDDDDDDGNTGPVMGEHHTFVVDKLILPAESNTTLKLDIDGDGKTENALGKVLSALISQSKGALDLQGSLDKGIAKGDIVLLADLQATDFTKAANAGLSVRLGEKPNPAPCTGPTDEVCGLHLKGTASFDVKATPSAADSLVKGNIVGGRFTGGPGTLALQLVLSGTAINLHLVSARASLTSVSADGIMTGIVGGAITKTELDGNVLPAVASTVSGIVKTDCPMPKVEGCGCPSGSSTGKTLLGLFDVNPIDCDVSLAEIKESPFISTLLGADLDLEPKGGDKQNDSLSVAVGVHSVKATWTP
jgi:hypothetical protein